MIIKDLIDTQSLQRDKDGYKAERTFLVTDVRGSPETKLYLAMNSGDIPQYGDPHPIIPDLVVTNIRSSVAAGPSQIRILVNYSLPSSDELSEIESDQEEATGEVTLSSSLSNEIVFRDINGELLSALYYGTDAGVFSLQRKYEEAEVQKPQLSVTFNRTETNVPKSRIQSFLGKVNSVTWSGFPPKTWLCSGISSRENKNKFEVEYQFTYRPDTWRLEVVVGITQEEANSFPIDVDSGNGYAVYDVYETADFNALGLNF